MNPQTSPRYATVTTVHEGVRYTPTSDPAWATASGADIPDGTLAYHYGSNKAAPADVPTLVFVFRAGRVVRAVDANTRRAVDEWSASARRWLVAATDTLTEADVRACPDGFSASSRRPEECRKCTRSIDQHTHVDPTDLTWDRLSPYRHLADRLHPVYVPPAPAVIICTDVAHVEGAPGCALPKCAGTPSVDTLTSRMAPVAAEAFPGECGAEAHGRELALALALMVPGADVTMPVYRDSRWYETRNRRQVQGYTLAVSQSGRYATVTVLAFETRSSLISWRPVRVVLVNGAPVVDAEGSALIEMSRMTNDQTVTCVAVRAAQGVGAMDAYGLRISGWTLPEMDEPARADGAPLGWSCCQAAPAALVVWDNGRTSAVCASDASEYARKNGERAVRPLPAAPVLPSTPAPVAPVAPEAPADSTSEAPTEAPAPTNVNTDSEETIMEQLTPEEIRDSENTGLTAGAVKSDAAAPEAPAGPLVATVDRAALAEALAFVVKATPTRPALPILAGVVITATGDTLTLRTFDFEQERHVTLPADVECAGMVAVPCKTLATLVNTDKSVTRVTLTERLSDAEHAHDVIVSHGASALAVETLPADDLPGFGFVCEPVTSLDVRTLADAVTAVDKAACRDAHLPFLNALHMNVTDGGLALFATDRYRAVWTALTATGARDVHLTPASPMINGAVSAMARHAGKGGAPVVIGAHEPGGTLTRHMSLTCGGYRVVMAMIDNSSPDFPAKARTLMPPANAGHVGTVAASALLKAVKTMADATTDKNLPVLLDWSAASVTVRTAGQPGVSVPCEYTGEPLTLGFKPAFLMDTLAPIGKGRARITAVSAKKGVLITPADVDHMAPAGYEHLIMTVRIDGAAPPAPAAPAPTNSTTDRKDKTMDTDSTPAPKSRARKSKAAPAVEAPAAPAENDTPAPAAPAAPVIISTVERAAEEALTALNTGDYAAALAAIDRAEAEAPAGYLVAGQLTFAQVRGQITAKRDASTPPAPAPVAEAPASPTYAPVVMAHDADGTALLEPPFLLRFKLSAALNARRGGLGWTWDKARTAWIMDGSVGQPVDVDRVARAVAVLSEIGLTVDDRTGVTPSEVPPAAPVVSTPAPVASAPVVAEAPAPVASASDTAVIDAARAVGTEILATGAAAPVSAVFDVPADVDTSAGYKPVLMPVKRALAAAGLRVYVTHVGRRVTIVPASGALTAGMRAVIVETMAATVPAWSVVLAPASV